MTVTLTYVSRYTVGGSIFTGVTKPADHTPMGQTSGVPTGGTDVGGTVGASVFTYTPTITMSDVEQIFGMVAPRMTSEVASLKFTCLEATYLNLKLAMSQATSSTDATHFILKAGGNTTVTTQCVAIISKNADSALYHWLCLYSAVSMSGLSLAFKRGEPRQVAVTLTALADTARTTGDLLAQYMEETF